jgi:hypothetical protein
MTTFTIGCDPEIFLKDQQGKFKSVIGLLGADKWHPLQLTKDGHAVLEDNVAVEFNIPPCNSFEDFAKEIQRTMQMVKDVLPKDLQYTEESAVSFPETELNCEEAWIFGCEPDYNAYTRTENPKPNPNDKNLRSCGGHIHVGSDIAIDAPFELIHAMDLFLGVPSTQLDSGVLRRELYGKAGAFRPKPYGVEYRTLSNFWIFSPKNIQWAYDGTKKAIDFVKNGLSLSNTDKKNIQNCINTNNQQLFQQLNDKYGLLA